MKIDKKQATTSYDSTNKAGRRQQPLGVTVIVALVIFLLTSTFAFNQSPRPNPFDPPTVWEKFFKPQERNAFMRLPVIKGNLKDVFVLPGSEYIWAVGEVGLIIHSKDGGETWQQQIFPGRPEIKPANTSQGAGLFDQLAPVRTAHAEEGGEKQLSEEIVQQKSPDNAGNQARQTQEPVSGQKGESIKLKEPQTRQAQEKKLQIEEPPEEIEQEIEKITATTEEPGDDESITEPPPDLYAIYFIDKNTGVAVGTGGTILKTTDGGESWTTKSSGTTERLTAIAFSEPNTGVAVGSYGTILKTTDGGETWTTKTNGTKTWLNAIAFSDANTGVAVGYDGTILKTTDGGESWTTKTSGTNERLTAITFSEPNTGIAVGGAGTILKTSDGGKSWTTKPSGTDKTLNAIAFSEPNTGIAVGGAGTILKTSDGGKSWTTKPSGTNDTLVAIAFSDTHTGVAVGIHGTVLKTTDGGETWTTKTNGTKTWLNAIAFSEPNTGVAVGYDGTILKTTDGGESWTTKTSGTNERLTAITFSEPNTGVAVGTHGTILKTTDGGESWTTKASGTDAWLSAIAFSDTNTGLAVGTDGTVLKTSDGGESWTTKTSGTNERLTAIAFSDTNTGVAVGTHGTILKTTDGAESWTTKASGTDAWLSAIAFSDDTNTGLAVGTDGTVLKTSDGGETWQGKSSDSRAWLNTITFSDTNTGLAVGSYGTILKTTDGGESWTTKTSGTDEGLTAIAFADGNSVVAVGDDGTILKTTDGGESWTSPEYRRYPALWYWVVCGFFLLFAHGLSQRRPGEQQTPTETVADILASDRPIQPGDPDPLNFGAIARGLSRFMRNPSTEPPLTVAITGAWGTGKSSLMNLLYYDLKQYGFTPVWFNAWHHQKGEQLLASLYANIYSQAIPGWFNFSGATPVGLRFRLNLFFRRSSKNRLLTCLLIALPIAVFTYLFLHSAKVNGFDINAVLRAFTDADKKEQIIALLSGLPPLAALMRSLRAFGINPAQLIALGTSENDRSTRINPSARQRFAKEFKEVTESLELGRMVIFIDDLDRCSKENVVDILESINFLSVSGGCYIILGMDKGWVTVCIEQQFPEMKEDNHNFANEYLEKLINIDVPVPTLENEGAGKLLAPEPPEVKSLSPWETFRDWFVAIVTYYRYFILVGILATIGITFGLSIDKFFQAAPKQKDTKLSEIRAWDNVYIEDIDVINGQPRILMSIGNDIAAEEKPNDDMSEAKQDKHWQLILKANDEEIKNGILIGKLGAESSQAELLLRLVENKIEEDSLTKTKQKPNTSDGKQKNKSSPAVEFRAGQTDDSKMPYLLPATVLIFIIIGLLIYILRKPDRIVNDSSRFRDALRIWHPWVTLNRQTPRTIKRYLNRVRYIAMRYREEINTEDKQQSVIVKLLKSKSEIQDEIKSEDTSIDEPNLVALSAIFAVDESWIIDDEKFKQIHEGKLDVLLREKYPQQFSREKDLHEGIQESFTLASFMEPLNNSLMQHEEEFGDLIFIEKEQRKKFLDILAATKVK